MIGNAGFSRRTPADREAIKLRSIHREPQIRPPGGKRVRPLAIDGAEHPIASEFPVAAAAPPPPWLRHPPQHRGKRCTEVHWRLHPEQSGLWLPGNGTEGIKKRNPTTRQVVAEAGRPWEWPHQGQRPTHSCSHSRSRASQPAFIAARLPNTPVAAAWRRMLGSRFTPGLAAPAPSPISSV